MRADHSGALCFEKLDAATSIATASALDTSTLLLTVFHDAYLCALMDWIVIARLGMPASFIDPFAFQFLKMVGHRSDLSRRR